MATVVIRLIKRFVSFGRCRCGEKTALRLFFSMVDHFAGHCGAIEAVRLFSNCRIVRPRSRQQCCSTFRSVKASKISR